MNFPFGATFGFVAGAAILGPAAVLIGGWAELGERTTWTLAGVLLGSGGMGGAVIGATRDILAYLRRALPVKHGPEADYGSRPPETGIAMHTRHATD